MSKLQIINGQFIRNGQVEMAEFGNLEQIRCIKDTERLFYELKSGLIIEPDYDTVITSGISFKCSCQKNIYMDKEVETEDNNSDWVGQKLTCLACNQKYIIETNNDGDLIVMFDNK